MPNHFSIWGGCGHFFLRIWGVAFLVWLCPHFFMPRFSTFYVAVWSKAWHPSGEPSRAHRLFHQPPSGKITSWPPVPNHISKFGGVSNLFFVSGRIFLEPVWPKQFHWTPMCPRSKKIITAGRDSASPLFGASPQNVEIGVFLNVFLKNSVHQELQNFNY